MPYEDEYIDYPEPDPETDQLAKQVIGAAIEVHRHLGPGLAESIYEAALCVEFDLRGIPYTRQFLIGVTYKGVSVGQSRIDLLVDGRLIVELKAVDALAPVHRAQLISYLRIAHLKLGLLLNFNTTLLRQGIQRVILS